MPTVVDELVVRLGLDITGIRQGQASAASTLRSLQDAFRRYGQDIERSTSSVGAGLATIRLGYAALATVAVDAFAKAEQFAAKMAAQNTSLGQNAAAVRETAHEYDRLRRAVESVVPGGGAGVQSSLDRITQDIEESRRKGQPIGFARAALAVGITTVDASGKPKDPQQLIHEYLAALKTQHGITDLARLIGYGQEANIDRALIIFDQQADAVKRKALAQADATAATQKEIDASNEVYQAWRDTGNVLDKIGRETLVALKPGLLWIFSTTKDIANNIEQWIEKFTEFDTNINKRAEVGKSWDKTLGTEPGSWLFKTVDELTSGGLTKLYNKAKEDEKKAGVTPGPSSSLDSGTETTASFYDPTQPGGYKSGGIKMASGENYSTTEPTAASRTLPFGTMVDVTNPETGKSVRVRINDRGPYVQGRDLDLNRVAAEKLGMVDAGTAKVKYSIVPPQTQIDGPTGLPKHVLADAYKVVATGGPQALQEYLSSVGVNRDTNWCGDFAAAVYKHAGLTPPKNYSVATNWRGIGPEVPAGQEQPGDIAVRRGPATGETGSHVGFVARGGNKGQFDLFGGNQGPAVVTNEESRYQFYRVGMLDAIDKMSKASQPNLRDLPPPATGAGLMAARADSWGGPTSTTNNNTNDVNIGAINLHNTQITDPVGFLNETRGVLQNHLITSQANFGPN